MSSSPDVTSHSGHTDSELSHWLRWQSEHGSNFLKTIADAALIACLPDYQLLRPVLVELKKRNPQIEASRRTLSALAEL